MFNSCGLVARYSKAPLILPAACFIGKYCDRCLYLTLLPEKAGDSSSDDKQYLSLDD